MKYFLSLTLAALPLLASDNERCFKPPIHCLEGIVLFDKTIELMSGEENLRDVKGLQTIGVEVPGGTKKLQYALSEFYGHPLCKDDLKALVNAISTYYKEHMHPLVVIEIPKQKQSSVLQLIVTESRLGMTCIQGNRTQNLERILSRIELQEGDLIDERVLLRDMQFIDRNPFRRINYIYTPGEKLYTTDLLVEVEERRPVRVYVGGDNTGVSTTGQQRWFAGFNMNITGWADHNLSFQFTTGNSLHEFLAYTGQYLLLLPYHHILNFYGGYSSVHVDFTFPGMTNHGTSYQISGRYIYLLNPTLRLNHEIGFGFDMKETNSDFNFGELISAKQPVNLFQIAGKYMGNYASQNTFINYDFEMYWSPGKWLPDQSNSDYQQLRPGAKNHWVYALGAFTYNQKLPGNWWFFSQLRGQFTGENLLPSEQLGIGGYDTVRGYKERQLNKDKGIIANIEFRTPSMKLFFRKNNAKLQDALQFLAFFDGGYGSNHEPLLSEPRGEYLLGTGPGVRYTLNNSLTGRLDWGFKLHQREAYGGGPSMFHFSLIGSY